MSMCLYLKHATESDLARFARDGVDEEDLDVPGGIFGGVGMTGAMSEQMLASFEATEKWMRETLKTPMDAAKREQVTKALEQLGAQMEAMRSAPTAPKSPGDGRPAPVLDLHKSWHMLHYLFTGQAWEGSMPGGALLLGGEEVGEDMGYGPARALSPQDTANFAGFLAGLDVEKLAARLDMEAMARMEIYCAESGDPDAAAELEEDLEHYFPQLQSFVADAASRRQGLLIWMS